VTIEEIKRHFQYTQLFIDKEIVSKQIIMNI